MEPCQQQQRSSHHDLATCMSQFENCTVVHVCVCVSFFSLFCKCALWLVCPAAMCKELAVSRTVGQKMVVTFCIKTISYISVFLGGTILCAPTAGNIPYSPLSKANLDWPAQHGWRSLQQLHVVKDGCSCNFQVQMLAFPRVYWFFSALNFSKASCPDFCKVPHHALAAGVSTHSFPSLAQRFAISEAK